MTDTPRTGQSNLIDTLCQQAEEIAKARINGWGNTMLSAASELAAVTAERDALLAAIRQQWELLPLLPTATPGSYARGYDSGMRDTLTVINNAIAASKGKP